MACSVQFKDAAVEVAEGVEEGAYSMQSTVVVEVIPEEEAEAEGACSVQLKDAAVVMKEVGEVFLPPLQHEVKQIHRS